MAIDAVIDAVKREPDKTKLWLRPRIDSDGLATLAGRRVLYVTRNPHYAPQTGDKIWGNAHTVVINKENVAYQFQRIMALWDGTFEVLA